MKFRSQDGLCAQNFNTELFNMNNTVLLFVLIVLAVGVKESIQGICTDNFCSSTKDSAACNGCCIGQGCSSGGRCSVLNGVTACHCDRCTSIQEPHSTCTSTFCSNGNLDDNGCKGCCLGMLNGCAAIGSCNNSHCKCNSCAKRQGAGK
ncbi:keratin-associated protein 17-1-like [Mytilus californianus]|uniref:keratin-associated protein 17-1-like n=1 Tax=Mytilus californianus TaxID=6549 RepID=UPI002246E62A|nr:keratin-associated protein 17-1-like [Mytilus californianus]